MCSPKRSNLDVQQEFAQPLLICTKFVLFFYMTIFLNRCAPKRWNVGKHWALSMNKIASYINLNPRNEKAGTDLIEFYKSFYKPYKCSGDPNTRRM